MTGWTSHVSPIPNFPDYTGPYKVGTIDVEIASADLLPRSNASNDVKDQIPTTVSFRCFYPCQTPGQSPRPVHWVPQPQKETLDAFYKKFLKTNAALTTMFRWMTHFLYYTTIPALRSAPLLDAPYASKRWPVLVFSHGLAGSRNSYSHICGSLASHGIVVLAPDHRDGSSPIQYIRATPGSKAETLDYRPLPHTPSREVYEGRDEQLRKRLAELSLIHEALIRIDRGEELNNLDRNENVTKKNRDHGATTPPGALLAMFRGALDVHQPGHITWAGHSFGGATTIQFTKSVFYAQSDSSLLLFPPSEELKAQITPNTPTILLDPWALPLNSPTTKGLNSKPLPCFAPNGPGGDAVLTVLSEAFFNWRGNLSDIKHALRDPDTNSRRPSTHIFYPIRSAHLSQSDYGILFPNMTKLLAKADEPERTLRLNVRAILEVMRNAGLEVSETSAADLELVGPTASDGLKGDASILSRKEDSVRGWVALGADEDEAQETARIERTISRSDQRNGNLPLGRPLLRRTSSAMEAEMVGMPSTELGDAAENGSKEDGFTVENGHRTNGITA